eukprot:747706-Hanusia_phi.AAC.1
MSSEFQKKGGMGGNFCIIQGNEGPQTKFPLLDVSSKAPYPVAITTNNVLKPFYNEVPRELRESAEGGGRSLGRQGEDRDSRKGRSGEVRAR